MPIVLWPVLPNKDSPQPVTDIFDALDEFFGNTPELPELVPDRLYRCYDCGILYNGDRMIPVALTKGLERSLTANVQDPLGIMLFCVKCHTLREFRG